MAKSKSIFLVDAFAGDVTRTAIAAVLEVSLDALPHALLATPGCRRADPTGTG
ncbi:MAG: hypothetical protein WKF78_07505 [Candidatus Limnocylindrales bacterium]